MARWADDISEEEQAKFSVLLRRLLSVKPTGWSCVRGDRELVLRPEDRSLGKISMTVSAPRSKLNLSFFSPSRGHWDASDYFPFAEDSAEEIVNWAQAQVEKERDRAASNKR